MITAEIRALAAEPPATLTWHVGRHLDLALRRLAIAAIFAPDLHPLQGDLARYPHGLRPDGTPQIVEIVLGGHSLRVRAAALPLADGSVLVIGRDMRELRDILNIVLRALFLSFLPALAVSLAGGAWLGYRALIRVGDMHRSIERIVGGDLQERLPEGSGRDDLERLAGSVNRMLGRMESLVAELRAVGDSIAHDLRTPLARVRTSLERARAHPGHARDQPERMQGAIDRAIVDLDRVFDMITALLRIAEFETGRRRAGFGQAGLRAIAADAIELYEPVAEAAGLTLALMSGREALIACDRDLLIEAVANLLDNACKFTPAGGHVAVAVAAVGGHVVLSVDDDGIGLSAAERGSVLKRFYRADRSRHVPGNGLGLSLVAAIAALHDATVTIEDLAPGTRFALVLPAHTGPPG